MVLQDVITGGNWVKRMWDFSVLFLKAPCESTMISTSLIKNVYKPLKRESKEIMGPSASKGQNPDTFHALETEPEHCLLPQRGIHMSALEALRLSLGAVEPRGPPRVGAAMAEGSARERVMEASQSPQRWWDVQ